MSKQKRRWGDRKDARRIRDLDSMHAFMPYLLPNRTDNEAVLTDYADVKALEEYIAKKNADSPEFKYTIFHAVLAALAKTIYLRPKMNYFYQGHRLYERNDILFAFTAKRKFEDSSEEALALLKIDKESDLSPMDQIYGKVKAFVTKIRKKGETDGATDIISVLCKLPRFLIKFVVGTLRTLDYYGLMPQALASEDPYSSTVYVSNLGSIKSTASYHHLANWGTNSLFVIIGEIKMMPVCDKEGNLEAKKVIPLGITVDERIADGFYFAKSFKIFKHLLENPELLDRPLQEEIDFKV